MIDGRHRKQVIDNLNLAYRDELSQEEKKKIAKGVYQHLASMFADLLRARKLTDDWFEKNSEYVGWENLLAAEAHNKGILILASHFGFWELLGVGIGIRGKYINVLARILDNPLLEKLLNDYRSQSGNIILYKTNAVKAISGVLKNKGIAGVLIDQNVNPNRGIFVDFFGVPACTTSIVSSLAVRTGAPIVPVFALPLPNARWKFVFEKPLIFDSNDRSKEKIHEITQICTDVIEKYVRMQPDIWLWLHRRWKTRPPEENREA